MKVLVNSRIHPVVFNPGKQIKNIIKKIKQRGFPYEFMDCNPTNSFLKKEKPRFWLAGMMAMNNCILPYKRYI